MTNTIYSIPQIQEILTPIFMKNGVRKAILFGSYGKGTATEKSDVDLMVECNLHGLRFVGLLGEVSDALQKEVDCIDKSHIEPNSLVEKEINQTGVVVYEE